MPKEVAKRRQNRIPGVKRPQSGYTFFCNEKWEEVKKHVIRNKMCENGTKLQCSIMKELSVRWKKMPARSRQKFEKKAVHDSKRYREEKNEYMKTLPPKKPRNNPYIYFFREMQSQIRERNPDMKQSQIAKEVAQLWPAVKESPESVRKYETHFQEDMNQYNQKMSLLSK